MQIKIFSLIVLQENVFLLNLVDLRGDLQMGRYMSRKERHSSILNATLKCVERKGLFSFSIADVADEADCGMGTVKVHFGNIHSIRVEIVIHAKENNISSILNIPITDMIT